MFSKRDVGQYCPFHKRGKRILYKTYYHYGKVKNLFICGVDGCEHCWDEDVTEEYAKEFNA